MLVSEDRLIGHLIDRLQCRATINFIILGKGEKICLFC